MPGFLSDPKTPDPGRAKVPGSKPGATVGMGGDNAAARPLRAIRRMDPTLRSSLPGDFRLQTSLVNAGMLAGALVFRTLHSKFIQIVGLVTFG